MALRRFDNWPELLAAFLAQHRNTPFDWGRFDCALFAADAIHVMTGTDLAEPFRLQYAHAVGARRKLHEFCGGWLEEAMLKICAQHGLEEIPVELAQRGDLLLWLDQEGHPAAGIADGKNGIFAGKYGLAHVPIVRTDRAWKVG